MIFIVTIHSKSEFRQDHSVVLGSRLFVLWKWSLMLTVM